MPVYFIQGARKGPIKIGYSHSPADRLRDLQLGSADELQILATLRGDVHIEHRLHAHFRQWRLHREWFRPNRILMGLIDMHRPQRGSYCRRRYRADVIGWAAALRLAHDLRRALSARGLREWEASKALGVRGHLVHRLLDGDASVSNEIRIADVMAFADLTDTDFDLVLDPVDPFSHPSAAHLRAA